MPQYFHTSASSRASQHMTKADGRTGRRFDVLVIIIRWLAECPRDSIEQRKRSKDYGSGAGKSKAILWRRQALQLTTSQRYLASRVLVSVSVGTTRCSVAILIAEQVRKVKGGGWIASLSSVCAIAVWTLVAPMVMTINCVLAEPQEGAKCRGEVSRTPRRI